MLAASTLLLAGAATALAPAASASDGSVPPEVAAYATDPDGLVARLADLFGPTADGRGIDFDETTTVGQLNRAFVFTDAFLAGESTQTPIELVNEWTAPISLAEQPVGLAVIWINQTTIDPELADFTADAAVATALADVPADAALVHDADRQAWFALTGSELVALVPGSSGVAESTTLGRYQQRIVDAAADARAPAEPGAPSLAVLVIVVSLVVIVGVLVWPLGREWMRRRRSAASIDPAPEPEPEPDPDPEPDPEPEPEPEPAPAAKAPRKRPAAKARPEPEPAAETPAAKPPRKRPAPRPKAPQPGA